MNKRSFFRTLGSAVVGIYLGLGVKKVAIEEPATQLLSMHSFESRVFIFMPSFQDFIRESFKYSAWDKLLEQTHWEPNQGSIMRGVKMSGVKS